MNVLFKEFENGFNHQIEIEPKLFDLEQFRLQIITMHAEDGLESKAVAFYCGRLMALAHQFRIHPTNDKERIEFDEIENMLANHLLINVKNAMYLKKVGK